MLCHSDGAFVASEESLLGSPEILRYAQDDIFEMTCNTTETQGENDANHKIEQWR